MLRLEISIRGRDGMSEASMICYALSAHQTYLFKNPDELPDYTLVQELNILCGLLANINIEMANELIKCAAQSNQA